MEDILPNASGENAEHIVVGKLIIFEILSVVLQLLSIVFNGAIICTLCRRSLLKYPSNRFVFSLCLSHLVVSFLSVSISPFTTFLSSHRSQPLHTSGRGHDASLQLESSLASSSGGMAGVPVQCTGRNSGVDLAHLIMMHLNFGVAVCTSITVALISAERYITIARPMRYKSIVTARRSLCAIICSWLLAALITLMPLLLFENRNPVCGTFSVPMESLATYFGIVFSVVTVFALAVMIVCYTHIFRIAKAKCQKVQIGHFTASTVSSISSDWPSSAYSTTQGQHRFLHAGSRIESSNSLLHWVLMTNLGRHAHPLSRVPNALRGGPPITPPATPTLPPKNAFFSESALNNRRESDETTTTGASSSSRNGSTSSSSSAGKGNSSSYYIDPSRSPFRYHHLPHRKLRNRWKTYLQPNYNSPRKTIFTIVLLIGAVLFTQLPLSFVLFTSTVEATQRWFQFCTTVLFSTSSVANPILYGFLNRNIRDQLWRLLRLKHRPEHGPSASSIRKRKRGQQQLEEIAQNSKSILSPANHHHLQSICRSGGNLPAIKISRKESISSDDNSVHSITSVNSMNTLDNTVICSTGSNAKGKINQVQKRITSSPYYRSVLLKKAQTSRSLLPRLAMPDVNNTRRNSSGSVIAANGAIMSKRKGKVKEMEEGWDESANNHDEDRPTIPHRISIEMQTFRNYSTPDLPLVSSSHSQPDAENDDCNDKVHSSANNTLQDDIPNSSSQNKCEGQDAQLSHAEETEQKTGSRQLEDLERHKSEITDATDEFDRFDDDNTQPGPSHLIINSDQQSQCPKELDACPSAESLVGVVIDHEVLPENFPRKPSQDSGADMTFSDEEDESGPVPVVNEQHGRSSSSPLQLSALSLSSLPIEMMMLPTRLPMRTTGEVDSDNSAVTGSSYPHHSSASLVGPLLLIGHPDSAGNFRNLTHSTTGTSAAEILLLPCSCTQPNEIVPASGEETLPTSNSINDVYPNDKVENGVTVTITDSSSDTQLSTPQQLFNSSNRSLLQANSSNFSCIHFHHPICLKRAINKAYKSKSESDICTVNSNVINSSHHEQPEFRVRSNCHIDNSFSLGLGEKPSASLLSVNKSNDNVHAFTLCNDCSQSHVISGGGGLSSSLGRHIPTLTSSVSQQYLLQTSSAPIAIPLSHSQQQQWLSVMSVHSSCSSLSSTCPLRILDGYNNKSDISDYDDFEDHIEI